MSAGKVYFNQLKPDQWKEYKSIRLEALKSDPIAFATTYEQAITYTEREWREKLSHHESIFFIAKCNNKIVGTIGTYLESEKLPKDTVSIVGVFVSQAYRGKGIGRILIKGILEVIKSHKQIRKAILCVCETQNSARKLYESVGFYYTGKEDKKIHFHNKYYDELKMEKIISKNSRRAKN